MKKLALLSSLGVGFLCSSLAWTSVPARAQSAPNVESAVGSPLAPADSYFGRFRMSVLGIRNSIKDIALRVDGASEDDLTTLYHKLTMVQDAILDLKDRYPHDSWIPAFGLSLAQTFALMPFGAAQVRANDTIAWLMRDYPQTDAAFFAGGMRRMRLQPVVTMDVPIEPVLPSYAVPATP